MAEYKYKKGDKVAYLGNHKEHRTGTIKEIYKTNDGMRNLYLLHHYPYLRFEEEIVEMLVG